MSRAKRGAKQGQGKPVGNSLKALAKQTRAEENGGKLPAPSMTIPAPGSSRKANDRRRRTKPGHG